VNFLDPPRRLQLRRLAVLRILAHPFAAARLLGALAEEAEMSRRSVGAVIRACTVAHVPRR
jgi:hypothetical protein